MEVGLEGDRTCQNKSALCVQGRRRYRPLHTWIPPLCKVVCLFKEDGCFTAEGKQRLIRQLRRETVQEILHS